MKYVGLIGWRGLVGSVLMERMLEEKDFDYINPIFFSTSQYGKKNNFLKKQNNIIENAFNIDKLKKLDIIITCQGGDYTNKIYFKLREIGWNGYWIDASSALRMKKDAIIILDPINKKFIKQSIQNGIKTFVGGNCTVSLMLMALGGLFTNNLIEWISVSTYQAASGAGSKYMQELLLQMKLICENIDKNILLESSNILSIEKKISILSKNKIFPQKKFLVPLACSLIPWIDVEMKNGQSKEEWKGQAETNKILNRQERPIKIDGLCIRISSLRCHSQSFTIKLKQDLALNDIEHLLCNNNSWVQVIPNEKLLSLNKLTPSAVSGTLNIPVGRIRKLNMGPKYISAFTVGDQLLWGAAEPLRRMLRLLI